MPDDQFTLWDKMPVQIRPNKKLRNFGAELARLSWPSSTYVQSPLVEAPPGYVALDFETTDPTIKTKGSAWAFPGQGAIIGMGIAWKGFQGYFPMRHIADNVDESRVFAWLKHHFLRTDITFICAKASYDMGWARREIGLYPAGGVHDVQFMAALLDEYRMHYALDSLTKDYLCAGKDTTEFDALKKRQNITTSELMQNLAHLPGRIVAGYGMQDAAITRDLFHVLLPKLKEENLIKVHDLESALIPMTVEMRRRGMRVDIDKTVETCDDINTRRIPELQAEIQRLCGVHVDPWDASGAERALASFGYVCKKTAKGQPNVDAVVLGTLGKTQPVAAHILKLRKLSKVASTFLEGHILSHEVKGRVHAEVNQLKSEYDDNGGGFGTVTGRFSYASPGLQQIPVRDPELGPLVRSMFLAEEGEKVASLDYSSQEPRFAVHFAYLAQQAALRRRDFRQAQQLKGADLAVAQYHKDPRTDYHQMVADFCNIPRAQAKTINLGLGYGMGGAKLARSLGLATGWKRIDHGEWNDVDVEDIPQARSEGAAIVEVAGPEAQAIIRKWEKGTPFLRGLFKIASERGEQRGYVTTIFNRRCRFEKKNDGSFGWTHIALNRICQSSSADQTKQGMLDLWKAGHCPLLTVHDELVFSVATKADAEKLMPYMRDAVRLTVPTVVDVKVGETWGDIPK